MGTGKESMRNQAGKNGESQEAKAERQHRGSRCEAETGRTERKKQRLSSQNPKLKRTKESENSGGQKVDWIAAIGRVKVRPRERLEAKVENQR